MLLPLQVLTTPMPKMPGGPKVRAFALVIYGTWYLMLYMTLSVFEGKHEARRQS